MVLTVEKIRDHHSYDATFNYFNLSLANHFRLVVVFRETTSRNSLTIVLPQGSFVYDSLNLAHVFHIFSCKNIFLCISIAPIKDEQHSVISVITFYFDVVLSHHSSSSLRSPFRVTLPPLNLPYSILSLSFYNEASNHT